MQAEIVILGSGTSMGIPTLGCECKVCTSADPRNARSRPSIAIQWPDHSPDHRGNQTVIIDTGPDFRTQALREKIHNVDAVFYTHGHADHVLGMDDLRPLSFRHSHGITLYADDITAEVLERVFEYTFAADSKYPTRARVTICHLNNHEFADVAGVRFQRVPLLHGTLTVGGFRFGSAAYLTDMSAIPDSSLPLLENLDAVIIDALRPQPHPSHATIDQALEWIERLQPRRAFLTHMSHEVEHSETESRLPPHVRLTYDGLRIPFEI